MTAGFLMPCHSTPWRSHLISPSIHAWALSCEPPVSLNSSQKSTYLDEADQFYADPADFLQRTMPQPPRGRSSFRPLQLSRAKSQGSTGVRYADGKRQWPDYLVFFAHLESTMGMLLKGSGYGECYRTFNSHAHDDWRRKGDIVVWCLRADELAKSSAERAREDKAKEAEKAHADKAKEADKAKAGRAKDKQKERDNEKWARERARAKEEKLKGLVKRAEKGNGGNKGSMDWRGWAGGLRDRWRGVARGVGLPGWRDDLWA
jgi:GPI mannosyltransferase 3